MNADFEQDLSKLLRACADSAQADINANLCGTSADHHEAREQEGKYEDMRDAFLTKWSSRR